MGSKMAGVKESFCAVLPGALTMVAASLVACSYHARQNGPALLAPCTHPTRSREAVAAPLFMRTPQLQLGIDLDFYAWPGMDEASISRADIAYIKHLHANSVSINFPFFTNGPRASTVHATSATPSPSQLAALAARARAAGLYVTLRPLLDENSIGMFRMSWKPADPAAWFTSYQRFLLPYARMAQAACIPGLFTGVEFTQFSRSARWGRLDTALRRVYKGTLLYSSNWWNEKLGATTVNGVQQTLDAYRPLPVRANAPKARVVAAWKAYAATLPAHVVLSEVGIAAQPRAYTAPYRWSWPGEPLRPAIQVRWFTGACRAVAADHLGGIYFWSLNVGQPLTKQPTAADPSAFVAGPAARSIAACYQRLSRQ